jgi:hypothetical protein
VSGTVARLALAVALAATSMLVGCVPPPPIGPVSVLAKRADDLRPATFLGLPLRSGQLLVTESPDATSFAFMLFPEAFHPFTHIGVIAMEEGEPWVYDVTGGVKGLPLRERVLDNVHGTIFRRPLLEYASYNLHGEIYDPPPGVDGERLAAWVRARHASGDVEFDTRFDPVDHATLYCSELVALAIEASGGKAPPVGRATSNPTIVRAMEWLGVPAGLAYPVSSFIAPERFVGALGPMRSRTSAWAYFEAKREIYRRFTEDQRLGAVLTLGEQGQLGVRQSIVDFAFDASHLFDAVAPEPPPGDPRIRSAVQELASKRFGPLPAAEPPPSVSTSFSNAETLR